MKRMVLIRIFLSVAILLSAAGLGFSEDSVVLTASFTIPAIPGVNAPLLKTLSPDNAPALDNGADNSNEEVLLAQSEAASQTIQTYYSR